MKVRLVKIAFCVYTYRTRHVAIKSNHDIGLCHKFLGAHHPFRLYRIIRGAKSGGINYPNRPTIDIQSLFNGIAGRSCDIGNYGAVFTDTNGVERMVEIKAVVRKVDEEVSAQEMLDTEVAKYAGKVAKAEAAAQEKREKAEKAKAKREAAKAKKEAEAEED